MILYSPAFSFQVGGLSCGLSSLTDLRSIVDVSGFSFSLVRMGLMTSRLLICWTGNLSLSPRLSVVLTAMLPLTLPQPLPNVLGTRQAHALLVPFPWNSSPRHMPTSPLHSGHFSAQMPLHHTSSSCHRKEKWSLLSVLVQFSFLHYSSEHTSLHTIISYFSELIMFSICLSAPECKLYDVRGLVSFAHHCNPAST